MKPETIILLIIAVLLLLSAWLNERPDEKTVFISGAPTGTGQSVMTSMTACLLNTPADKEVIADADMDQAMPCGQHFVIKKGEHYPTRNIPCPCGDPRHWLFRRTGN